MSSDNPLYAKNVLEFVAVGVEYCRLLETSMGLEKPDLVDKLTKLMPLLYLKATLLPAVDDEELNEPEQFVGEEHYESLRLTLVDLFDADDVYLDTFVEDMKYSETPIGCSIAEGLADIYQDIKNFVEAYRQGIEEAMKEALAHVTESFATYWGQVLVNTLRPLHALRYDSADSLLDEEEEER